MARRVAADRRRAALATGAVIAATAAFAPAAHAAPFEVNTLTDAADDSACDPAPGGCTLRDAVGRSNANAEADTITFSADADSGEIRLTQGELVVNGQGLTITGPGAADLSISGDANNNDTADGGDSRIFEVQTGTFAVSDLELKEGVAAGSAGGAIAAQTPVTVTDARFTNNSAGAGGAIETTAALTVTHTTLSDNTASGPGGGAIDFSPTNSQLKVIDSTLTSNSAPSGGAIRSAPGTSEPTIMAPMTITGSTLSGNQATIGSGGAVLTERPTRIDDSTLSGNTAVQGGGAVIARKYGGLSTSRSTFTNNTASTSSGGAILISLFPQGYASHGRISETTISGNHATSSPDGGGGLSVGGLGSDDRLNVVQSTISGNDANSGSGGGVLVLNTSGDFRLTDSTVSGNSASTGAGLSFGTTDDVPVVDETGSAAVDNSTIASNTATTHGGGIFLASYASPADHVTITSPTVQVTSSIVGDNTANGAAEDADRGDNSTGGGLDLAFGLVEAPGDAPMLTSADRPSILGQDPRLGALADNGGVTKTQAPALDSPAIDKGFAPARPGIDQRGQNRTVDGTGVDNAPRGDGSDIGAVELQNPPVKQPDIPPPPPPPANVGPTSAITKNALAAKKAKKRVLRGTAADSDGSVAKVEVAIVRKKNGKCSSLKASGRFSKPASCSKAPIFLAADGTKKWTFKPEKKLPHGNFVVFSRATDDDGAVQDSFPARSVDPFRIG